jgi:hypothetical protein
MLEDILIILATSQQVMHFNSDRIGNFVVFHELSKDEKTRMVFVTFFYNNWATIITSD